MDKLQSEALIKVLKDINTSLQSLTIYAERMNSILESIDETFENMMATQDGTALRVVVAKERE